MSSRVLVIGGSGALGQVFSSYFAAALKLSVLSVDVLAPPSPSSHPLLHQSLTLPLGGTLQSHTSALHAALKTPNTLPFLPFRAIVCAAGGWVGGGVGDANFPTAMEDMNTKCLQPALLSSTLACTPGLLEPGGLLILTGSAAAFGPTPTMVAYGLAKVATHALARSLAAPGSGLPPGAVSLAMAPHVIDTPSNRKWMAEGADVSTWTTPLEIAKQCGDWVTGVTPPPPSGTVVEVVTAPGGVTRWVWPTRTA